MTRALPPDPAPQRRDDRVTTVSRTGGVLRRMVWMSCRRPRLTVALSLLLAALGLAYTLHALTFETSTRALLPQSAGYVVRYAEYSRDFGELEDIVVVVEAGSFEAARAYGARLAEELRASGIGFNRVAYRVCAVGAATEPRGAGPGARAVDLAALWAERVEDIMRRGVW